MTSNSAQGAIAAGTRMLGIEERETLMLNSRWAPAGCALSGGPDI